METPDSSLSPPDRVRFPVSLAIVVALFFVHGTVAVVEMIIAHSRDVLSVNLGAVSLFVAVGMLLGSPLARWVAIAETILLALLFLVFAALAVNGSTALLHWFGNPVPFEVPARFMPAILLGALGILAWQLEVLTRPATGLLFRPKT